MTDAVLRILCVRVINHVPRAINSRATDEHPNIVVVTAMHLHILPSCSNAICVIIFIYSLHLSGPQDDMNPRVCLDQLRHLSNFKCVCSVLLHQTHTTSMCYKSECSRPSGLTSKAFCICPGPKNPRSPPFFALEQSLISAAVLANCSLKWSAGSDAR